MGASEGASWRVATSAVGGADGGFDGEVDAFEGEWVDEEAASPRRVRLAAWRASGDGGPAAFGDEASAVGAGRGVAQKAGDEGVRFQAA